MIQSDENPYAPPTELVFESKPSTGSLPLSLVSALGTVAFLAFTMTLFQSSTGDRIVGFAFLANALLMICLVVAAYRSTRIATFFGSAAIIVQVAIMLILLSLSGTKKTAVLLITISVVLPLLVITFCTWRLSKNAKVENLSFPSYRNG